MKEQRKKRFDFEEMKHAATSADRAVRKQIFIDYFEEFGEFPSYLFDNEHAIDARLLETLQDLLKDPDSTRVLKIGIDKLFLRLPA